MSVSAESKPSGSGTVDDPYKIGSVEELFWFRDKINDGTISKTSCADLTANIDLSSVSNWTPIGNKSLAYSGTFDGRNYTVSNITCNSPSTNYIGFFGYTKDASIKNIHFTNGYVEGYEFVGGVVGTFVGGDIYNCSFTGTVYARFAIAGGICGATYGSTTNMRYCWATDTVKCDTSDCGGLLGMSEADGMYIDRCYALNNLVTGNTTVGGLVAWNRASTQITDCYRAGNISDINISGSICGANNGSLRCERVHVGSGN
ncbi:MAG: hypothetical protein IJH36_06450, partial [Clostridia bacterium]|nr:hypothetical protein [Clostridia bacterium]